MNWIWILFALLSPFLYAVINHTDKYLIEKYIAKESRSAGALVLVSSLFAIVALPVLFLIEPQVLNVQSSTALILLLNGGIMVVAYICYFKALFNYDPVLIAPFQQLIPIFGFILGFFLLGETASIVKIMAMLSIIVGSLILSITIEKQDGEITFHFEKRLVLIMLLCTLCYAVNAAIFKLVTPSDQIEFSLFWLMAGKFLFGVLIFLFYTPYRTAFLTLFKENRNNKKIIFINFFNEVLGIASEVFLILAIMIAPIAYVQVVGGFQPVFVLLIALFLARFYPKLENSLSFEKVFSNERKIPVIISIVLVTIGAIVLSL